MWVFFALLDPDPDSGSETTDLIESGSETLLFCAFHTTVPLIVRTLSNKVAIFTEVKKGRPGDTDDHLKKFLMVCVAQVYSVMSVKEEMEKCEYLCSEAR